MIQRERSVQLACSRATVVSASQSYDLYSRPLYKLKHKCSQFALNTTDRSQLMHTIISPVRDPFCCLYLAYSLHRESYIEHLVLIPNTYLFSQRTQKPTWERSHQKTQLFLLFIHPIQQHTSSSSSSSILFLSSFSWPPPHNICFSITSSSLLRQHNRQLHSHRIFHRFAHKNVNKHVNSHHPP